MKISCERKDKKIEKNSRPHNVPCIKKHFIKPNKKHKTRKKDNITFQNFCANQKLNL